MLVQVDVSTVYSNVAAMKEAQPVVWWRAVCYHYIRRTRQVTRWSFLSIWCFLCSLTLPPQAHEVISGTEMGMQSRPLRYTMSEWTRTQLAQCSSIMTVAWKISPNVLSDWRNSRWRRYGLQKDLSSPTSRRLMNLRSKGLTSSKRMNRGTTIWKWGKDLISSMLHLRILWSPSLTPIEGQSTRRQWPFG